MKNSLWKRALWMQLGALNGLVALLLLLATDSSLLSAGHAASIRLGAQIHFMHSMATLSCATFMNIGARDARNAPAFFLSGILLFCLPIYTQAIGAPDWVVLIKPLGLGAFVTGWLIMAWSAREIDRG